VRHPDHHNGAGVWYDVSYNIMADMPPSFNLSEASIGRRSLSIRLCQSSVKLPDIDSLASCREL
jgi:hypothetical protein